MIAVVKSTVRHRRRSPLTTVLWVNAVLLAGILGFLIANNGSSLLSSAHGQALNNIGGGAGVYVVPAQFGDRQWGCYLVDVDQQTLIAYEFFGGEKQLKFVAARSFKYDRRLGNYSTSPSSLEIQRLLEHEKDAERKSEVQPPAPQPLPPVRTPVNANGNDGTALPPEPH
jgi:hypothetical protein